MYRHRDGSVCHFKKPPILPIYRGAGGSMPLTALTEIPT
jgi:hypothetical protein